MMKYYKIYPEYAYPDGKEVEDYYAKRVDDNLFLMDFPVNVERALSDEWPSDLQFDLKGKGKVCDVLLNSHALFMSEAVRCEISPLLTARVEWLPAQVKDIGRYYIMHPLESVELGPDFRGSVSDVSGNVTWINKYDFDRDTPLPDCFTIKQPRGSAARGDGFCVGGTLASEPIRWKLGRFRGIDFAQVYER
jgi:hypothetical protein